MIKHYEITVKQLVKDETLDHDDRLDDPKGDYDYWAENEDAALDHFHETVAIACLDHYEITIKPATRRKQ